MTVFLKHSIMEHTILLENSNCHSPGTGQGASTVATRVKLRGHRTPTRDPLSILTSYYKYK